MSETAEIVRNELGSRLSTLTIERATIGAFFTGVQLSSGYAGACSSAVIENSRMKKAAAHAISDRMQGRPVREALEELPDSTDVARAVCIATLNALGQMVAQRRARDRIGYGDEIDAFDAANIQPQETVVIVGAFVPFLRKLRTIGAKHVVLEKDPSTLKGVDRVNFRKASQAPRFVPSADVLIITGATLLNETLGDFLDLKRADARTIVVGPSVPILPDALFGHGIDIVGSIRVTDPDVFMSDIARGARGYHLFGKSAVKVALRKNLSSPVGDGIRGWSRTLPMKDL